MSDQPTHNLVILGQPIGRGSIHFVAGVMAVSNYAKVVELPGEGSAINGATWFLYGIFGFVLLNKYIHIYILTFLFRCEFDSSQVDFTGDNWKCCSLLQGKAGPRPTVVDDAWGQPGR